MNVGDTVTAEWTWGGHRFQASGVVTKVSGKTVKVRLTEHAGEHFAPGFVVTVPAQNVRSNKETMMARRTAKPGQRQWQGIDRNEASYNSVRNALVGIFLDGVAGVSPELPGHGWRMVPLEKADQYIEKGRRVLADFESQACAPGGARGSAQKWMDRHIDELRRLVSDAEAVRAGSRPQKMTPDDYEKLRKSLGAHGVREARVDRTSRGRFAGKRVPAPDPGMNPFAPQARIRLDNQWRLGDVGAVYEFNVKLGRVEAEVSDAEWEHNVQIALEGFEDALKNKYPWIGQMYLTGRSGGWLALEDPKGKMTKKTLEALSKLVEASKRQFIKDMEQDYPRGGTVPMTARAPHTVAIGGHGEVIPSRRWKNSRTGAIASPYGAVPWTGAPGDRKEDWELETVGWTIRWADGTVGIGRQPFATKAEAEAWLEQDRARRESYRRAAPAPTTPPRTRRRRR